MSTCEPPSHWLSQHKAVDMDHLHHPPLCLPMQDGTCRNKEPSSDKGFFGLIFAMLIVPAIVILGIAFGSGYMVRSRVSLRKSLAAFFKCEHESAFFALACNVPAPHRSPRCTLDRAHASWRQGRLSSHLGCALLQDTISSKVTQ